MYRVEALLASVCLLSLVATACGPKPVDQPAPSAVNAEAAAKLIGTWEAERPAGKSEQEQAVLDIVDLRAQMEFKPDRRVTSRTSMRNLNSGEIETSENTGTWKVLKASEAELTVELPAKEGYEQHLIKLLDDNRLEMKAINEPDTQPQRWNRMPAADDKSR